jgi:hypothetical protein
MVRGPYFAHPCHGLFQTGLCLKRCVSLQRDIPHTWVRIDGLFPDVGAAHRPLLQECGGIKPSRVDVTVLECGDGRSVMIGPIMQSVSRPATQILNRRISARKRAKSKRKSEVDFIITWDIQGLVSGAQVSDQLVNILTHITPFCCCCYEISKETLNCTALNIGKVKLSL